MADGYSLKLVTCSHFMPPRYIGLDLTVILYFSDFLPKKKTFIDNFAVCGEVQ